MLQNATRTLSLDKILYCEGLSFGVLRHARQVRLPFLQSVDALIIQPPTRYEFEEILRSVRQQGEAEDYLIPVFLASNATFDDRITGEVDGVAHLDDLNGLVEIVNQIQKEIANIAFVKEEESDPESLQLFKIMQYLYTRKKELLPFPSRQAKIHFRFPFASLFFTEKEEHRVLGMLKLAEKKGWLSGKTIEKIHCCPDCGSAHQNLRATCPKCQSVDLKEEDLVHHFPCAHIAPLSDFEREGQSGLHCPKCDKTLRHIGNDYDKPSSINNCNHCHHSFQQSNFKSLCIDCGIESDLHDLVETNIRQLELTDRGRSVVMNGTGGEAKVTQRPKKENRNGIFDFDIFKILVKQEVARKSGESLVGQVRIDGLQADKIPAVTRQTMTLEVCQIIKSYLKEPDVVSARNPGSYYFLLPDRQPQEADFLNELLSFNLQKLIESNFRGQKVDVKVQLEVLEKK